VLLSTWVADHERTVLAPADVVPMLGDDGTGGTGGPTTANTFNQVTSWQARGAPAGQTALAPASGAGPRTGRMVPRQAGGRAHMHDRRGRAAVCALGRLTVGGRGAAAQVYDLSLDAALRAQGCGPRQLTVEGDWAWLLGAFAGTYGVRPSYAVLAHLRWVVRCAAAGAAPGRHAWVPHHMQTPSAYWRQSRRCMCHGRAGAGALTAARLLLQERTCQPAARAKKKKKKKLICADLL